MTFAEDKTYKYIRDNHSKFCCVDVLEILPYLSCLTASDQDRLRASYRQIGNRDTLWGLFNNLQRRPGWVEVFIRALQICELPGLADQVTRVYQSYLPPGTSLRSLEPLQLPDFPAAVSGPSAFAPGHNIPDHGLRETPSCPKPVQDTQPPESPVENSEQLLQTNSGAVARMSGGSLIPSPNQQALSPQPSREHQEQEPELGGAHAANVASVPIATYGPVSPTVSFQPLPRTALRTNLLSGVTVSALSADTSLSSSSTGSAFAKGAGDQAKAATCFSTTLTNSVTTSSVPFSQIGPSKNHVFQVAHQFHPFPSVAKAPANTIPPERNSKQAKETPEGPATKVTTGGNQTGPNSSIRSLHSGPEMSKPGVLVSQLDEPFSACSVDLAISPSSSLVSEPNHGPEENEYSSFRIQVDESPSADLLGSPEPLATQQPQEEEEHCASSMPWAKWLGATSALLAVFLAVMLYRSRRLAQ